MSARRPLLTVICLAVAVLAGSCRSAKTDTDPEPTAKPISDAAVLAFSDGAQMRFADGTGRVWGQVKAKAPEPVIWSSDGSHVAFLESKRLHIVDAKSATDRSLPCPCSGLDRMGQEFVTISTDGTALLFFGTEGAVRRLPLSRRMIDAWVVAGGSGQVAVAEPIPEDKADYRGQSALIAVDGNGKLRQMIEGKSAVSVWAGYTAPAGDRIATVESPSGGACSTLSGVLLLDNTTLNRKSEQLTPSDSVFKSAVLSEAHLIKGMIWAGQSLIVTFAPNNFCQRPLTSRYLTYSITGTQWQFLQAGVLQAGYGADSRSYAIELNESGITADTPNYGTLVMDSHDGKHMELGQHVQSFWPTVAEQAAGTPVASATPEESGVPTVTDQGKPLPPALHQLADEVVGAIDRNDVAALATLCAKCDSPTRTLVRTPAGRTSIKRSLLTHAYVDQKSATFPGAAFKACDDGPKSADGCTTQQFQDIGRLGLVGDQSLDLEGWKYAASISGSVRFELDGSGVARWLGQSNTAMGYLVKKTAPEDPDTFFFQSPDGKYYCGLSHEMAGCQGATQPLPPRPADCEEGPGWGEGMFVNAQQKADFLCSGGVMFYPSGRGPEPRDRLAVGQSVAALGYTCTARTISAIRCTHDASNHGFEIQPNSNKRF
jgi:hypothetical protein